MKSLVIAGFTGLLLQVNAGALPPRGGLHAMDKCQFAKAVDMSSYSSQCAKEAVYAGGFKSGRAGAMFAGLEKQSHERKEYSLVRYSPPPPSPTPWADTAKDMGITLLTASEAGVGAYLMTGVLAGVTLGTGLAAGVGFLLVLDAWTRAESKKGGVVESVYKSYFR